MEDLVKRIKTLEETVAKMQRERITQSSIIPGAVKQRHMGESNRYIWSGLEADLPDGFSVTSSVTAYFATDTNKLYIWNGTAFKSTTLT